MPQTVRIRLLSSKTLRKISQITIIITDNPLQPTPYQPIPNRPGKILPILFDKKQHQPPQKNQ